ncbi:hypothetical protein A2U01_0104634, partial [Trifolium medium]|nr:hypothetical protein [Trifolium medium]
QVALIAKIYELEGNMLSSAHDNFDNDVAQIKCLNPDVELKTEGMSILMKVKDGQLALHVVSEEDVARVLPLN